MKKYDDDYEGFDYESYDEELDDSEIEEIENPYDDYEMFDLEVVETIKKKICVFAKDKESAKKCLEENLDKIDMDNVDEYKKEVYTTEWCGSQSWDYAVPLEYYD